MFIPMNIAIVSLMLVLMLLASTVLAIRQVRILDRELREAQRKISKEIPKDETRT